MCVKLVVIGERKADIGGVCTFASGRDLQGLGSNQYLTRSCIPSGCVPPEARRSNGTALCLISSLTIEASSYPTMHDSCVCPKSVVVQRFLCSCIVVVRAVHWIAQLPDLALFRYFGVWRQVLFRYFGGWRQVGDRLFCQIFDHVTRSHIRAPRQAGL